MAEGTRHYTDFYAHVETAAPMSRRLRAFVDAYEARRRTAGGRMLRVLDIGCGREAVLMDHVSAPVTYEGCDIHAPGEVACDRYRQVDLNTESLLKHHERGRYDVVFCGEVIEHLFSPDDLLEDVRDLLAPGGIAVVSTPNLAYWLNRVLLLAGISPLFLENSSRAKLGRRFRALGQGNATQGHIRLFTYPALIELAERTGLRLVRATPVPVWGSPVDRLVCRFSRRLAPDNVCVFRRA